MMDKLKMHTPNLADEKYKKLAELFPNAVTETVDPVTGEVVRAIDRDVLMQEINTRVVEGREERYQFTWPDKKKAVLAANAPISATLRPVKADSVGRDGTPGGWDSENLYIEGDNLDVLKLLRETYLGKVKMIYIDPCMGSGHILVYAFDVLMEIYRSVGYTDRDAARSIVENNLYGLDIDDRAAQLAYFAVMMKACEYDRRFLKRGVQPHVCAIRESAALNREQLNTFGTERALAERLLHCFEDAKEYGSLLHVDFTPEELNRLEAQLAEMKEGGGNLLDMADRAAAHAAVAPLMEQARILARKYDAVITNPPYMGSSGMNEKLSRFVKDNYPDSKSDLFAVFMERCGEMLNQTGYQAMITQHAWMFLSSYEKLRGKLQARELINMAHLGPRAFEDIGGEVVQTTAFVLQRNHTEDYRGHYARLIEPTTQDGKEEMFLAETNRYIAQQENFKKIPGMPVAYWVSERVISIFESAVPAGRIADFKHGMSTGKNEAVLRFWYELLQSDMDFTHVLDEYFQLNGKFNKRDEIAVRKTMSGLIKLLFPDQKITREETRWLLEYAIEGRRRVKEQLKIMAGVEFADVDLGYVDEDGNESIVQMPEQTSETLIPVQKLPAGHVYAIGANQEDGEFAVYRLENKVVRGNGKFEMQGVGSNRPLRESMNAAWYYFQNNAKRVVPGVSLAGNDYLLYYDDVQGKYPSSEISIAEWVGLCSALMDRPVLESLAIVGEIKLSGSMGEVKGLENIVRVTKNAGARRLLLPMQSMQDMMLVPSELLTAIQPMFYVDPVDAVKKALDIF